MATSPSELLGRGFAFPFGVARDGRIALSEGTRNVRESLRIILLTEPGERLMRRDFGAGLKRLLFEPNTPATRRLIAERIARAITRWEPRVRLESVQVNETDDPRRVRAEVEFSVVATGARERVSADIELEG